MAARLVRFFSALTRGAQFLALATLVAVIFVVDYATGYQISMSLFYLLPITLGTWAIGRRVGLVLSITSAGFWLAADVLSGHRYSNGFIPVWNAGIRLGFFAVVVIILAALKTTLQQRDQVIRELEETLRKSKTFDGVRPICGSCRRIRDTDGAWLTTEDFLREKSNIEFASGICPDCAAVAGSGTEARGSVMQR